MKKLLILLFGLILSFTLVNAQNINADTTTAAENYALGKEYYKILLYDSAAAFFQNSSDIYKKYNLWDKYLYAEVERANCINLLYNFDKAFEIIESAMEKTEGKIKKKSSAYAFALFHFGNVWHNMNLPDSALTFYDQALKIREEIYKTDNKELADSYYYLNKVYFNSGQFDMALYYNEKAYNIGIKLLPEDDFFNLSILNDRGLIELYSMRHRNAEELFEKTYRLSVNRNGKDNFDNIFPVFYLGLVYQDLGDYDKAIEYQEEGLRLSLEILGRDHYYSGNAYQNLANSYTYNNQNELAAEYMKKAIDILIKIFGERSEDAAGAVLNLGIIYSNLNDYENAHKYLNKSLELFREIKGEISYEVSRIYQSIATSYTEAGEYEKADEYNEKTLTIKNQLLDEDHYSLAMVYSNIGMNKCLMKDYETALEYFRKADGIFRQNQSFRNVNLAINYNNTADTYRMTGDPENAMKYAVKALYHNFKTEIDSTDYYALSHSEGYLSWHDFLNSLQLKAEIFAAYSGRFKERTPKENLKNALYHFKVCDTLISKIKISAPSKEDKMIITSKSISVYQGIVKTCFDLIDLSENDDEKKQYSDLAFHYSEKNKASILLEALAGAEAQKFAGIPDSLLRTERNLQIDISYYKKLLVESSDSTEEYGYNSKLFNLNREYDELIALFEKKFPKYHDLKYAGHNVRIEDIQNTLGKKTGMISYFTTDSSLIVYFLTGKKYIYEKWPLNDDFFPQIQNFRGNISDAFLLQEAFTNNDDRTVQEYINNAYDLYKLLFPEKVRKLIKGGIFSGIEKLIIIPDGHLSTIPFEALLTENYTEEWTDWNNTDYFSQMPFLLKDLNISYAYSANLFYQTNPKIKDKPEFHDISDWLALAPVFNNDSISGTNLRTRKLIENNAVDQSGNIDTRGWLRDGSYIAPLPGSEEETKSIFKIFEENDRNAVLKTHKYANEEYVKSGVLKDFKFLHIATHGMVNEEKPELSCILLAQDTTSNEDNILFSGEIYNLELNADLTVLSACETGLGKIAVGEGVIGLTRALLYAGSKNIIVSLWQVSDQSTNQLMVDFYKNIFKNEYEGFSENLKQSKLKLINEGKYAHPFFWSPFVLIGN